MTPAAVPADAEHPGPGAGSSGPRGSGRHGAARGSSGGNPPVSGSADADGPALGRTGNPPVQPMPTLGSAHRLNAVRGPRASGHPPWEPAEKPVSELPWMDAPGSAQNRKVPPRRVYPVAAEGQEAGPGGTGAGRPASAGPADPGPSMTAAGLDRRRPKSQSPFPDLNGPPAGVNGPPAGVNGPPAGLEAPPAGLEAPPASSSAEDAEAPRRMYSWNPSDPTEAFPAVPPPGDSRPG